MKLAELYKGKTHSWMMLECSGSKNDTHSAVNQYFIHSEYESLLMDPGGIELFSPMLAAVLQHTELDKLTTLFASHQDPDIIATLSLWDKAIANATLYAPSLWDRFIGHFDLDNLHFEGVSDEGGEIQLGGVRLRILPAHYLHAAGNFHLYDPTAKVLMSANVGSAIKAPSDTKFVEDFSLHVKHIEQFHKRWMPSNQAKANWIARVKELDINILAPNHGKLYKGEQVQEFLEWFDKLDVGSAAK
ncbi:MBL fold metallo-hydrolase [Pseudoalteromonas umbrosa]|uniref:MBL fold metallo-hydrolase n=1 Tax=Pseudoalteromonas umbrosa TaxID=3048489 RepID=UPI0024C3CD5D|nr:MBL fold metallo-hydrolase [Pseudoalteromonas sp. B95]MDK1288320.1 MBL fold metallo-hydrolase [Pseudoalteromonas sp. B95]